MERWYIVTGRIAGADEDSLFVFQAASQEQAAERAEQLACGETFDEDNPRDAENDEWFLNTVVSCDAEPKIEHNQNDSFFVPVWPTPDALTR